MVVDRKFNPSNFGRRSTLLRPLHDDTAASLLLRSVGILAFIDLRLSVSFTPFSKVPTALYLLIAYLTPYRRNHEVASIVAIINKSIKKATFVSSSLFRKLNVARATIAKTYDRAASDTLTRGRSKSSLRRVFSSVNRRYFRSATLCFLFLTSPPPLIS